jgi:hypothetical protein
MRQETEPYHSTVRDGDECGNDAVRAENNCALERSLADLAGKDFDVITFLYLNT